MKAAHLFRVVVALTLGGCNAILGIEEPLDQIPAGGSCVLNSDCQLGQRCIFSVCSIACNADLDCDTGQRCLRQGTDAACVSAATARCRKDADCGKNNVCAEGQCRNACGGDGGGSCLRDQTCANGICVGTNEVDGGTTDGGNHPTGATCTDGKQNGNETDVDCGGGSCPVCEDTKHCAKDGDCATGSLCASAVCTPKGCTNGLMDGAETDVDCGGTNTGCPRCSDGDACAEAGDCTTGVCSANQCAPAACGDSVKNGSETDVDCGGSCPKKCADNLGCAAAKDCESGVCSGHRCQVPTCSDNVKNGDETDTDCGGKCPRKCADGAVCAIDADCEAAYCSPLYLTCAAPTCSDGFQNADEADVDCGGTACVLTPCAYGRRCKVNADCSSDSCSQNICRQATCTDKVRNGIETDVDCGGGSCPSCPKGKSCNDGGDCITGACPAGVCADPFCPDGSQDGGETAVDCGGPTCAQKCPQGQSCNANNDCQQGAQALFCVSNRCVPQSCNNGSRDNDETATDCGGRTCAPCGPGLGCTAGIDCLSGICTSSACQDRSCTDGVKNGGEIDVDCGPGCGACADGKSCKSRGDCSSGQCRNGQCQAVSCADETKNGGETGLDCGGTCPGCLPGERCSKGTDCLSGVCKNGACQTATCSDNTKNADEADIDCGRVCSELCKPKEACKTRLDCTSNACVCGECAPLGCGNGVKDGKETDVDCGGTSSTTVGPPGDAGADGGDGGVTSRSDGGVVDGGGTVVKTIGCAACAKGKHCKVDDDCADGPCNAGVCGGGYTDFGYSPANFDPTDFELQPTAVGFKTIFDCGVVTFDSTTLAFDKICDPCHPAPKAVVRSQSGGADVAILPMRNLIVARGSTLRVVGSRPVIFAVYGDVIVDGTIDASAQSLTPGAGGNDASCGARAGAPGVFSFGGLGFNYPGGGGGGFATRGGNGGDPSSGAGGAEDSGNLELVPLTAGCPGGGSVQFFGAATPAGAGGGAVQISAARSIVVTGSVLATGGVGPNAGGAVGAAGGGSGGAIRLEANGLDVRPSGRVIADGGHGGAELTWSDSPGGAGGTEATPAANGGLHVTKICILFPPCLEFNDGSGGGGGSVGRLVLHGVDSCTLRGTTSAATKVACPLVGTGAPDGGPHEAGTD